MNHTPGPWHFIKDRNKRTIYREGHMSPRIGFAHNDENARLIAAAPDLLQTLGDLVHVIEDRINTKQILNTPTLEEILLDSKKVIAKAEGKIS
jgi:hypothetical protein